MVTGHCFVWFVLRQIDALKFAFDWKKSGQAVGGKKFKGQYLKFIYQIRTGREAASSRQDSFEDRKKFKEFKAQHQAVITARNYLLDLYMEVRFC